MVQKQIKAFIIFMKVLQNRTIYKDYKTSFQQLLDTITIKRSDTITDSHYLEELKKISFRVFSFRRARNIMSDFDMVEKPYFF